MQSISILIIILLSAFFNPEQLSTSMYEVTKVDRPITIDANWDKPVWQGISVLQIKNYMGDKPEHFPEVQAKLAYDEEAIYVIFKVNDRYVRAVAQKHQDGVFKDSCVEFFFSPETDSKNGYFNLEMNCGGKMLFHHQMKPRTDSKHISAETITQIDVAHSLPEQVDPEITDPVTWSVEYRIPFDVLKEYHDYDTPQSGTIWRANLYKCGDETSHPHWLTWAPIDFPRPNFHLPDFFGELKFQ